MQRREEMTVRVFTKAAHQKRRRPLDDDSETSHERQFCFDESGFPLSSNQNHNIKDCLLLKSTSNRTFRF